MEIQLVTIGWSAPVRRIARLTLPAGTLSMANRPRSSAVVSCEPLDQRTVIWAAPIGTSCPDRCLVEPVCATSTSTSTPAPSKVSSRGADVDRTPVVAIAESAASSASSASMVRQVYAARAASTTACGTGSARSITLRSVQNNGLWGWLAGLDVDVGVERDNFAAAFAQRAQAFVACRRGEPAAEVFGFAQFSEMLDEPQPRGLADVSGVGHGQGESARDCPDQAGVTTDDLVPGSAVARCGLLEELARTELKHGRALPMGSVRPAGRGLHRATTISVRVRTLESLRVIGRPRRRDRASKGVASGRGSRRLGRPMTRSDSRVLT